MQGKTLYWHQKTRLSYSNKIRMKTISDLFLPQKTSLSLLPFIVTTGIYFLSFVAELPPAAFSLHAGLCHTTAVSPAAQSDRKTGPTELRIMQ